MPRDRDFRPWIASEGHGNPSCPAVSRLSGCANPGGTALSPPVRLFLPETQALSVDPTIELASPTILWLPVVWAFPCADERTVTATLRGGRSCPGEWRDEDGEADSDLFDILQTDAWLYGAGIAAQIPWDEQLPVVPEVRVLWADSVDEKEANQP